MITGREEFYLQNFILEDIPPSQTDRMFVEMSLNLLLRRLDQTSGINKYWKVGKRKLPSLFLDIHSKLSIQVLQKFCLRREWRLWLKKLKSQYFFKNSIGLACFLFPFSLSWTNNVYTFKSEGLGSSYSKPISDQSLYLDLLKTDIFYLPVWTRDWAKPGPAIGLQLYFTEEDFVQDDTILYISDDIDWELLQRYERLDAEGGPVDGRDVGEVDGLVVGGGVGGRGAGDCLVRREPHGGNSRARPNHLPGQL